MATTQRRICSVIGCERTHYAKGFCNMHYCRFQKHGDAAVVATSMRHGHSRNAGPARTPEYRSWQAMKDRCTNPKADRYPYYGGRGIRVCAAWLSSFPVFLRDVGLKPSPEYTLERIENDGHYEPSNVKWATRKEQANNRRPMGVM